MMKSKKENYLDKIPQKKKDISWSKKTDLITIHLVHRGFYDKLAQKFFQRPEKSDIDLDAFGSYVWEEIDGEKSIFHIGQGVKKKFGPEAEPLYERLSKFFYILNQEKLISFKKKGLEKE